MATATAPAPRTDAPRSSEAGRSGGGGRSVTRYVLLVILAVIIIAPLIYILVTSFKNRSEATGTPPTWIPREITGQAYDGILGSTSTPVLRWFGNSMIAAFGNAILVVVTSALAAYPLARMQFRGKRIVFGAIVATLFIPPVILTIPNYLIVGELLWLDTLTAVIVPTAASAFGVFFLRQFFSTLPRELEEAAWIDGANRFQRFWYVTWPLLLPVTMVVVLFSVIQTFADFQLVYVLTGGGPANATHLFATYAYQIGIGTGLLSEGAAISLAMFPALLLVVVFQLWYIRRVENR